MRRARLLTTAVLLFAAGATAGAAQAQDAAAHDAAGQAAGLRYLSWSGRASAATAALRPDAPRTDLRRPNRPIPHGGFGRDAAISAPPPAPTRAARSPVAAPPAVTAPMRAAEAAPPRPMMIPVAPPAARADAAAPVDTSVVQPAPVAAPPVVQPNGYPGYLPARGGRQPAPESAVQPLPPTGQPVYHAPEAADPMAPRRDAPIFRMNRGADAAAPTAEPTPAAAEDAPAPVAPQRLAAAPASGDRPPQQGARYYSVHRQNGRAPDALSMPEPTYVDALAVTLPETPASQDLARPDAGPTLIRDNQGRLRAAPAPSDGDHQ